MKLYGFTSGVVGVAHVLTGLSAQAGTITQLNSPDEFSAHATTIDFDGFPNNTCANTLYAEQGIEFSRDDGQPVPIKAFAHIDTTSRPNVIATVSGMFECGNANPWVTHLNVTFDSPTSELGAFFGNDQGSGYTQTTLFVFDVEGGLLGDVTVPTNNNTVVDQFIGLSSDVPIFSAQFDNNGIPLSVVLDDLIFASFCPWDCDGGESTDGTVGITDFLLLLAQWGGPGSCDFDGGGVGINDFLDLLAAWGPCP